jgi:cysteine desulfurase
MRPIYLDYAATTPVDPRVAAKMAEYLTLDGCFANPASDHVLGHVAKHAVEAARAQVASILNAEPSEIIWTSGATEANNLAIKGGAELYQRKGKHLITLKTEHKTVLDTFAHLEKQGFEVTYLSPDRLGRLDLDKFLAALRPDTILASIMHINNELGVIQDIPAIAKITSQRGILLHVDAAHTPGKLTLDVTKVPVDLISLCAHKSCGPKGIGALYVRRKPRVNLAVQIHGGGQEQGMRSGTLPTHQIVAMGEAFAIAKKEGPADNRRIADLRERFLQGISHLNPTLHGDQTHTIPHILNLRFGELRSTHILRALPEVVLSTASACLQSNHSSHVLSALGLTEPQRQAGLRFSFGRFTSLAEIEKVIAILAAALPRLS